MANRLTLRHAVDLLASRSGLGYSIVPPGGKFGQCWSVCKLTITGPLEYSEDQITSGPTLYDAITAFFPSLKTANLDDSPVWVASNWRKGKYVGP